MAVSETLSSSHGGALVISTIVSILSLFGCLLILVTYAFFRKVRNFAFKLIIFLSIAELIEVAGNLMGAFLTDDSTSESSCGFQAFLVNFGNLSSMIWSSIIAWCLYSATVLNTKNLRSKNRKFVLAGFALPGAISGLHWLAFRSGASECFCSHKFHAGTFIDGLFHLLEFYIPLLVVLTFNLYSYSKVVAFMKKYVSTTTETRFIRRLRYYPLVMVVCWAVGGLNRLFNAFGFESAGVDYFDLALGGLQGFFNGLLFLSNSQVRLIWMRKVCCCLPVTMYQSQNDESLDRTNDSMEMKTGDDMKRRGIDLNKSIDRSGELSSRAEDSKDNKNTE